MVGMSRRTATLAIAVAVPLAAIATTGCNRGPHANLPWCECRVRVSAGMEPLTAGEVTLIADPSSSGVDAGGLLDGKGEARIPVLPGRYKVIVRPPSSADDQDRPKAADEQGIAKLVTIPSRFQSPTTSPHAIEITKGSKPSVSVDITAGGK